MSPASFTSLLPSRARRNSAKIEIKFNGHHDYKIYRPGSTVHGEVTITPWEDTHFDSVAVILMGISKVHVETTRIARDISHIFLSINMPILQPLPPLFEASHTYSIPFSFVIPSHLTLGACNHKNQPGAVFDQHMRLPPSMGYWSKDDLSPTEAHIEYVIKACVARRPLGSGGGLEEIMLANHLINVLPDPLEDPPLHITLQDERYTLRKSKTVRKNMLSAKRGLVTVLATQPGAIRLSPDGNTVSESAIIISLRFDSTSPETPSPSVSHIAGDLLATTWLSGVPMRTLPDQGDSQPSSASLTKKSYSISIPLVFLSLKGGEIWTIQQTDSEQKSSEHSAFYHEATLRVPFTIQAQHNMLLPTFHTCHTSRTYTLRLAVYAANTKFALDVPVQIIVDSET